MFLPLNKQLQSFPLPPSSPICRVEHTTSLSLSLSLIQDLCSLSLSLPPTPFYLPPSLTITHTPTVPAAHAAQPSPSRSACVTHIETAKQVLSHARAPAHTHQYATCRHWAALQSHRVLMASDLCSSLRLRERGWQVAAGQRGRIGGGNTDKTERRCTKNAGKGDKNI